MGEAAITKTKYNKLQQKKAREKKKHKARDEKKNGHEGTANCG